MLFIEATVWLALFVTLWQPVIVANSDYVAPETTKGYTHVSQRDLGRIRSSLDGLNLAGDREQ